MGLLQSPNVGAWGLLLDIKNFVFGRWRLRIVNSLKGYCATSVTFFAVINENHKEKNFKSLNVEESKAP